MHRTKADGPSPRCDAQQSLEKRTKEGEIAEDDVKKDNPWRGSNPRLYP